VEARQNSSSNSSNDRSYNNNSSYNAQAQGSSSSSSNNNCSSNTTTTSYPTTTATTGNPLETGAILGRSGSHGGEGCPHRVPNYGPPQPCSPKDRSSRPNTQTGAATTELPNQPQPRNAAEVAGVEKRDDKRKAREGPCHFGCLNSAKRRAGKEVWMSTPTPSPWANVPTGTTLCSRHYEQALTANKAHSVVRPSPATVKETKPDAIAGPPLENGRRTALSDGHYSGRGNGGFWGKQRLSWCGGEEASGGGRRY
jgi:hypothetical protein